MDTIEYLIKEVKVKVNERDTNQDTPLHLCAEEGAINNFKAIIEILFPEGKEPLYSEEENKNLLNA